MCVRDSQAWLFPAAMATGRCRQIDSASALLTSDWDCLKLCGWIFGVIDVFSCR